MCTVQPFLNLLRIASGTRKPAPAARAPGTREGRLLGEGGTGAEEDEGCKVTKGWCVDWRCGDGTTQGGLAQIASGSENKL